MDLDEYEDEEEEECHEEEGYGEEIMRRWKIKWKEVKVKKIKNVIRKKET